MRRELAENVLTAVWTAVAGGAILAGLLLIVLGVQGVGENRPVRVVEWVEQGAGSK